MSLKYEIDHLKKATQNIMLPENLRISGTLKKQGSIVCKDLLQCDISDEKKKKSAAESGLFKKIYPVMIRQAIEILEQLGY